MNLSAQFILARELGKTMLARGRGKIIFIASLLTFQGGITIPGYAASKGGIGQLTMALSNEWAGKGVNVNAIAPGYIETDNTAALQADPDAVQGDSGSDSRGPLGTARKICRERLFSWPPAPRTTSSGTILTVDGGWMGR